MKSCDKNCGNCFNNDGGLCPAVGIDEPVVVTNDDASCMHWKPKY